MADTLVGMRKEHNWAIKRIGRCLGSTPLHPQWLIYRKVAKSHLHIGKTAYGRVLDVGCADQKVREFLRNDCEYFGLDHYKTAIEWYDSKPDVFASAYSIPFADESFDTVLLIDVIEHLDRPEKSIEEITRILKPGGSFVFQAPFMYPVHDAPLDFLRWTTYGIKRLIKEFDLEIVEEHTVGTSTETIGMLINIAIADKIISWLRYRSYALILVPVILPIIPFINAIAWLIAQLGGETRGIMPMEHRLVLVKK